MMVSMLRTFSRSTRPLSRWPLSRWTVAIVLTSAFVASRPRGGFFCAPSLGELSS